MFGYGSLISPDCPPTGLTPRQRKLLIPYWLRASAGYRRVWNYRHGGSGINALGLAPTDGGEPRDDICGCVYPLDYERAVDLFCSREDGYELLLLHEAYFAPMHADYAMPGGVGYVWVCGSPTARCTAGAGAAAAACTDFHCKRHLPTEDSPILQSYVNSMLVGALRYRTAGPGYADGMAFAAALLRSIRNWDHAWVNDRLLPGRPWLWCREWQVIDGLLSTCPTTRDAFVRRRHPSAAPPQPDRQELQRREAAHWGPWATQYFAAGGACDPLRLSKSGAPP